MTNQWNEKAIVGSRGNLKENGFIVIIKFFFCLKPLVGKQNKWLLYEAQDTW